MFGFRPQLCEAGAAALQATLGEQRPQTGQGGEEGVAGYSRTLICHLQRDFLAFCGLTREEPDASPFL